MPIQGRQSGTCPGCRRSTLQIYVKKLRSGPDPIWDIELECLACGHDWYILGVQSGDDRAVPYVQGFMRLRGAH
jgi:hypothetical protein